MAFLMCHFLTGNQIVGKQLKDDVSHLALLGTPPTPSLDPDNPEEALNSVCGVTCQGSVSSAIGLAGYSDLEART